jgi:FSR family fosmidomycin resistance protein-like MFS transporter
MALLVTEARTTTGEQRAAVRPDRRRLALLALAHAVTDSYGNSFLSPVFPLLAAKLGLTLTMVGGLSMVMGLSSSLGQPLLGYLTDRRSRLCLVALGPAVAAVGCGLVGHMPGYGGLLLCLFITGLGIGAFHPQGASLAREASAGSSFAMSTFTVGGSIGFGLAPLAAALALHVLGLGRLPWIAIPGLLLSAVVWQVFRRSGVQPLPAPAHDRAPARIRRAIEHDHEQEQEQEAEHLSYRPLAFLTASVAVRAAVQVGMTTFLPFYLVTHRLPGVDREAARGLAVSAFLLANAVGGPLGGHLCDRLGRRPVMLWSFLLSVAPLLLAFQLPGYWSLAALSLGGGILALPHPSNVIMAQELMPHRAGIAASLITGLAWGLAMLLALPLGIVADHFGVGVVLHGLALLPLLGAPLVYQVPELSAVSRRRSALARAALPETDLDPKLIADG